MTKFARTLISTFTLTLAITGYGVGANAYTDSANRTAEKETIDKLFAAWNSGDVETVAAVFSNDAVYEDAAAGQLNRGKDEIRKWIAGAFADITNFKIRVTRSSFYKGGGTVEWIWSGTDKGLFKTGKNFTVRGVSVIEVRGGKVTRYTEYYDFATVMRQLGLLPADKN